MSTFRFPITLFILFALCLLLNSTQVNADHQNAQNQEQWNVHGTPASRVPPTPKKSQKDPRVNLEPQMNGRKSPQFNQKNDDRQKQQNLLKFQDTNDDNKQDFKNSEIISQQQEIVDNNIQQTQYQAPVQYPGQYRPNNQPNPNNNQQLSVEKIQQIQQTRVQAETQIPQNNDQQNQQSWTPEPETPIQIRPTIMKPKQKQQVETPVFQQNSAVVQEEIIVQNPRDPTIQDQYLNQQSEQVFDQNKINTQTQHQELYKTQQLQQEPRYERQYDQNNIPQSQVQTHPFQTPNQQVQVPQEQVQTSFQQDLATTQQQIHTSGSHLQMQTSQEQAPQQVLSNLKQVETSIQPPPQQVQTQQDQQNQRQQSIKVSTNKQTNKESEQPNQKQNLDQSDRKASQTGLNKDQFDKSHRSEKTQTNQEQNQKSYYQHQEEPQYGHHPKDLHEHDHNHHEHHNKNDQIHVDQFASSSFEQKQKSFGETGVDQSYFEKIYGYVIKDNNVKLPFSDQNTNIKAIEVVFNMLRNDVFQNNDILFFGFSLYFPFMLLLFVLNFFFGSGSIVNSPFQHNIEKISQKTPLLTRKGTSQSRSTPIQSPQEQTPPIRNEIQQRLPPVKVEEEERKVPLKHQTPITTQPLRQIQTQPEQFTIQYPQKTMTNNEEFQELKSQIMKLTNVIQLLSEKQEKLELKLLQTQEFYISHLQTKERKIYKKGDKSAVSSNNLEFSDARSEQSEKLESEQKNSKQPRQQTQQIQEIPKPKTILQQKEIKLDETETKPQNELPNKISSRFQINTPIEEVKSESSQHVEEQKQQIKEELPLLQETKSSVLKQDSLLNPPVQTLPRPMSQQSILQPQIPPQKSQVKTPVRSPPLRSPLLEPAFPVQQTVLETIKQPPIVEVKNEHEKIEHKDSKQDEILQKNQENPYVQSQSNENTSLTQQLQLEKKISSNEGTLSPTLDLQELKLEAPQINQMASPPKPFVPQRPKPSSLPLRQTSSRILPQRTTANPFEQQPQ